MISDKHWSKGTSPEIKAGLKKINLNYMSSLGSCFSRNVYRWLKHNNLVLNSNYWEDLFNPFSILSEFKRIFQELEWEENIIITNSSINGKFTDPWRTWLNAASIDSLIKENKKLDVLAGDQLRCSKTVLITFGLAEVWKKKSGGNVYLNNLPNKTIMENRNTEEYIIKIADHKEIFEAIYETITLIRTHLDPDIEIILTLSPIPLKLTFTELSVREANNLSKANLLIAIKNICSEFKEVFTLLPSYEIVQGYSEVNYNEVWQLDNRHITAKMIDVIAQKFITFCNQTIVPIDKMFHVPYLNSKGVIIGELFVDGTYNILNERTF